MTHEILDITAENSTELAQKIAHDVNAGNKKIRILSNISSKFFEYNKTVQGAGTTKTLAQALNEIEMLVIGKDDPAKVSEVQSLSVGPSAFEGASFSGLDCLVIAPGVSIGKRAFHSAIFGSKGSNEVKTKLELKSFKGSYGPEFNQDITTTEFNIQFARVEKHIVDQIKNGDAPDIIDIESFIASPNHDLLYNLPFYINIQASNISDSFARIVGHRDFTKSNLPNPFCPTAIGRKTGVEFICYKDLGSLQNKWVNMSSTEAQIEEDLNNAHSPDFSHYSVDGNFGDENCQVSSSSGISKYLKPPYLWYILGGVVLLLLLLR